MKTFGQAVLCALIGVGVSCSGAPDSGKFSGTSAVDNVQASVRPGLPPDAVTDTRRVCQGPRASARECTECVDNFADFLVGQGRISARQKKALTHLFKKECRDACIALSCEQDFRVCGAHTDPCAGPVECGTCPGGIECFNGACIAGTGPNLQVCGCKDGTRFSRCAEILDCFSGDEQDAFCAELCATHGGNASTGCLPQYPGCVAQ